MQNVIVVDCKEAFLFFSECFPFLFNYNGLWELNVLSPQGRIALDCDVFSSCKSYFSLWPVSSLNSERCLGHTHFGILLLVPNMLMAKTIWGHISNHNQPYKTHLLLHSIFYYLLPFLIIFTDHKILSLANTRTHTQTLMHRRVHFWSCSLSNSDISSLTHFELRTCSNRLDTNSCMGNLLLLPFCSFFGSIMLLFLEDGTPQLEAWLCFQHLIYKENRDCGRSAL